MKKILNLLILLLVVGRTTTTSAEFFTDAHTSVGEVLTIGPKDTLDDRNALFYTIGTLNNYGKTITGGQQSIFGAFHNYGTYLSLKDLLIFNGGLGNGMERRLINHAGGNMVLTAYFDMYSDNAYFENSGRFIAIKGGHDSSFGFFQLVRGTIKNTGSFLIDNDEANNACGRSDSHFNFYNSGDIEIAQNTNCNFAINPETATAKFSYTQDSGKLKVDGYFAAHQVRINGGSVTGIGTIEGLVSNLPLFKKVNLSPGSPYGTLTVTPKDGFLVCVGCSVDIEIAGSTNSDQLHINGDYWYSEMVVNVVLREGYSPQRGDSFDIITAEYIEEADGGNIFNLPGLSSGLSWDVQHEPNKISLTII